MVIIHNLQELVQLAQQIVAVVVEAHLTKLLHRVVLEV